MMWFKRIPVLSVALLLTLVNFRETEAGADPCPAEPDWTSEIDLITADGEEVIFKYVIENNEITILLSAETEGWIGFGIGELQTGSMLGADIVTASVGTNGKVNVDDWYVPWSAYPLVPDTLFPVKDVKCSDWEALSGFVENGRTTVTLKRALDTGDKDDRVISVNEDMRIIYAFGPDYVPAYHAATRGSTLLNLNSGGSVALFPWPTDINGQWELLMDDFDDYTRDGPTTYACRAFQLPTDTNRQIVAAEIKLTPGTKNYVHHMLVHVCGSGVMSDWPSAERCSSPTILKCSTLVYVWAVGAGPLIMPDVAGWQVGDGSDDVKYITVELHYDIPDRTELIAGNFPSDSSGVIFHYTESPRQYIASSFVLGDPATTFANIPKGSPAKHYEAACTASCTDDKFPSGGINVFASGLHMHAWGRQMYTTHKRKNENTLIERGRADFWNFEFQNFRTFDWQNEEFKVMPGDRLNTHCVYDTTKATSDVVFGTGSLDEMCMDFIFYYPRISDFGYCGYWKNILGSDVTLCGGVGAGEIIYNWDNFDSQPEDGYNRDGLGFIASEFGVESTQGTTCPSPADPIDSCINGTGTSGPGPDVGDPESIDLTWIIKSYDDIEIYAGDTVTFTFSAGVHDVFQFPGLGDYQNCEFGSATNKGGSPYTFTATPADAGQSFFFGCSKSSHCSLGQKVKITVLTGPRPGGGGGTSTLAPTPEGGGETVDPNVLIDWKIPTPGTTFQTISLDVGETIRFEFSSFHDLIQMSPGDYSSCNFPPSSTNLGAGPYEWTATEADKGKTIYLSCSILGHCQSGQKMMITVPGDENPAVVDSNEGVMVSAAIGASAVGVLLLAAAGFYYMKKKRSGPIQSVRDQEQGKVMSVKHYSTKEDNRHSSMPPKPQQSNSIRDSFPITSQARPSARPVMTRDSATDPFPIGSTAAAPNGNSEADPFPL